MIITRTELIKICDKFLADELSKDELIHFATTVMFDDEDKYECEDELVEEIDDFAPGTRSGLLGGGGRHGRGAGR
ncbi:MAG: hypothetical protein J0I88_08895, partial [Chryseobacterium sp.]|nr:hypothetical protein [Chryseobacterium sp.]